jgi:predicted ATP-binding protein involved in virulence
LYQNIGENNQVIVATHSPHIIGSSKAEEVFLLQIDENKIEARHPRYTKGHSIDYVLDEIMGANSRDTSVIKLVDSYLALMRKGQHESGEGLKIKSEIDALNLDPNSEEMRGLNLSIKRIKAVGV